MIPLAARSVKRSTGASQWVPTNQQQSSCPSQNNEHEALRKQRKNRHRDYRLKDIVGKCAATRIWDLLIWRHMGS
ncbi:hypothetical protein TNCT_249281 [Trichonephila clavata]|uniref:Uncharacterized protein n=1 Tax=Trichonephila clavata TaxID=2740835 RepID=A0A8X6M100_TRICU|nr:hypothetical protein TNCT_249281 [Trichonephila clavata]